MLLLQERSRRMKEEVVGEGRLRVWGEWGG